MRPVPVALAAALAAAGALTGSAALAQHGATPAPPDGDAVVVSVTDTAVVPAVRVVAPGTALRWINIGRDRHTVTADDGAFDSGILVAGDDFRLAAPATAATIPYHCEIHAFIRGTLVVSVVSLTAPEAVAWGNAAVVTGTVPGAAADTPVVVERRDRGAWHAVAVARTDPQGAYRARTPALRGRTVLRARTVAGVSPASRVAVRPRVAIRRAGRAVAVRITPRPAGTVRVVAERLDLDTYLWRPRTAAGLAGGRGVVPLPGTGVWRVRVPRPGPGLAEAASRDVAVTALPARRDAERPARTAGPSPHAH